MTHSEIAAAFGCSIGFVAQMRADLHSAPAGQPPEQYNLDAGHNLRHFRFEQRRAQYRQEIGDLRDQIPAGGRIQFYRQAPRQMQWLVKNDRGWLDEYIPRGHWRGARVDWKQRDVEGSKAVARVRRELIDHDEGCGRFRRLTRERLFVALGIRRGESRKGHYPDTLQAISRAEESLAEFKIRKLLGIIENRPSMLQGTFIGLLDEVGISSKLTRTEAFTAALTSAEMLYTEKKRIQLATIAA